MQVPGRWALPTKASRHEYDSFSEEEYCQLDGSDDSEELPLTTVDSYVNLKPHCESGPESVDGAIHPPPQVPPSDASFSSAHDASFSSAHDASSSTGPSTSSRSGDEPQVPAFIWYNDSVGATHLGPYVTLETWMGGLEMAPYHLSNVHAVRGSNPAAPSGDEAANFSGFPAQDTATCRQSVPASPEGSRSGFVLVGDGEGDTGKLGRGSPGPTDFVLVPGEGGGTSPEKGGGAIPEEGGEATPREEGKSKAGGGRIRKRWGTGRSSRGDFWV